MYNSKLEAIIDINVRVFDVSTIRDIVCDPRCDSFFKFKGENYYSFKHKIKAKLKKLGYAQLFRSDNMILWKYYNSVNRA